MAELNGTERIHIVGVGGAGMSALAKLLSARGHAVSGSDLRWGSALADLEDLGLEVWSGHRGEAMAGVDLVVASSAVPDSDPEVEAAHEAGLRVWRRPDLLEAITADIPTIGATGTHGKTSSTGMMVAAVRRVGLDPSFVVGGELISFRTNAAHGSDDLLVLEVDEAFGTFERVSLSGLMVTNVEGEHLEHFGSLARLEAAFARVVKAVRGPKVVCIDDEGAARLGVHDGVVTYGTDPAAAWRIRDVTEQAGRTRFVLSGPAVEVPIDVPRLGLHMARNAAGVVSLLAELGFDAGRAADGIARFAGVRRRFEHRGTVSGVRLIDDYAHHPTEVLATVMEAKAGDAERVIAVFQPHLYSRTEHFQTEFGEALALADVVIVTDVFGSREAPVPGVTGALVADAASAAGAATVEYVPHLSDLGERVASLARSGDLVLTMGAGDITAAAGDILASLMEASP